MRSLAFAQAQYTRPWLTLGSKEAVEREHRTRGSKFGATWGRSTEGAEVVQCCYVKRRHSVSPGLMENQRNEGMGKCHTFGRF
jgi:hypothetical protein